LNSLPPSPGPELPIPPVGWDCDSLKPPSSTATASSAGRFCINGKEAGGRGEEVLVTCASKSVSTPVGVATCGGNDLTTGPASTETELER
jgi:hypothetical protein